MGDHTPYCDGSMNRGHPTPTNEEMAAAVDRLARLMTARLQDKGINARHMNPTPTAEPAVPVAELRALLVEWRRYREEQRTQYPTSPDVPAYVAGIYHCDDALAALLARHTPEGE